MYLAQKTAKIRNDFKSNDYEKTDCYLEQPASQMTANNDAEASIVSGFIPFISTETEAYYGI